MIYCVWVFSFFSWVLSATSDILLPFNKIRTYRKTKGANMASGNNVLMVKVLLIKYCSKLFLWNRTYSQMFVVVSRTTKRGREYGSSVLIAGAVGTHASHLRNKQTIRPRAPPNSSCCVIYAIMITFNINSW